MAFPPEVQITRTVGKLNEHWVRKLMEHEMTEERSNLSQLRERVASITSDLGRAHYDPVAHARLDREEIIRLLTSLVDDLTEVSHDRDKLAADLERLQVDDDPAPEPMEGLTLGLDGVYRKVYGEGEYPMGATVEVQLVSWGVANLAKQIAERRGDGKFSVGELRKAMAGEALDSSAHDPEVIPLATPTDESAPSPQDWRELRRKFFIANMLADRSKDGTFSIEELECAIRGDLPSAGSTEGEV